MEKIANAPIRVKRAYGAFSVILTPDSSNVVLTLTEAGLEIVATFARGSYEVNEWLKHNDAVYRSCAIV